MTAVLEHLERILPVAIQGTVVRTIGMTIAVADFPAPVGALVEIDRETQAPIRAEVIGFRDELTLLYPLSATTGVRRGQRARLIRTARWLRVGPSLLGRVLDAEGRCIDGRPQPALAERIEIDRDPPTSDATTPD